MNMRIASIVTLTILGLVGCASNQKMTAVQTSDEPSLIISMKRTACYGTCPVYELRIYSDHMATLTAEEHLELEGDYSAKISDETYQGIVDAFNASDFFDFEDEYTSNMSDLPTTFIYYSDLRRSKKIRDYYGSPEELRQLEDRVEALITDLDWQPLPEK